MKGEATGYLLGHKITIPVDIPTGIISRPDEEGCISPKGLRFGNKITGDNERGTHMVPFGAMRLCLWRRMNIIISWKPE